MRTVYLVVKEHGTVMEVKLPIRKDEDSTVRYAICNDFKASKHRLAYMHRQRYLLSDPFRIASNNWVSMNTK